MGAFLNRFKRNIFEFNKDTGEVSRAVMINKKNGNKVETKLVTKNNCIYISATSKEAAERKVKEIK